MKLIALDVGSKRIGVAKADSTVRIAIPYSAVEVDGTEFKKIASLARAWDIDSFVIGLPRNSKGEETEQSRYVRKFAQQLKHEITGAKVCFQDESLTSVEAEKRLYGRYFYQKKLSRKPMESSKREFKRKRPYVGGTEPLLRNHTLTHTPNL